MRWRLTLMCGFMAGIALGLAIVTVAATQLERSHQIYTRIYRVSSLDDIHPIYPPTDSALLAERFPGADPLEVMTAVMNGVTCVEDASPSEDPAVLAEHVADGGGLVCSGMADLYRGALEANGFEARTVGLARSLLDRYDSHATVEVLEEGDWVIYDPTFGIVFEYDGRRLGAQEVKQALVEGGLESVEVKRIVGDVVYGERIEDYYMSWVSLFDNVTVRQPALSVWQKLPVVRWWKGNRLNIEVTEGHYAQNADFVNELFWFVAVVLPIAVALSGSAAILLGLYLMLTSPGRRDSHA